MKRISLVALSAATAAMAQAPKAAAPVAAPAPAPAPVTYAPAPVSYASAPAASEASTESSAPLAPIHDALVSGNPALPASIAWVLVAPSDFAGGKREAAFQWAGGPGANGIAIIDQYFGAFASNLAGADAQGQLVGGYISSAFGAGLRVNFLKTGYSSDTIGGVLRTVEADSTYSPTSYGVFGSLPMAGLTVFGSVDYGTPDTYGSWTKKSVAGATTTSTTGSSRSDALRIDVGAASEAKGDRGLSWNADLALAYSNTRNAGTASDDTHPFYELDLTGNAGRSFSADKFILAPGLKGVISYWNGLGQPTAGIPTNPRLAQHDFRGNTDEADYGYSIVINPNLSTILPVFEHWTVKGTVSAALEFHQEDALSGPKSNSYSLFETTGPEGGVGVRYERGRWAAEAQVLSSFLNRGPYFISGANAGNATNLFASLGITANFK